MKMQWLVMVSFLILTTKVAAEEQVANIRMGIFETKDIVVDRFDDPVLENITCYISRIYDRSFHAIANPSDSVISCVQRAPTDPEDILHLQNAGTEEVYNKRQSIGDKALRVNRYYDRSRNTVFYVNYTNQTGKGSVKHSVFALHLNR